MKKVHLMALPLAAVLALPVLAQNVPPAPPSNSSSTDSSQQNTQQQPTTNSSDQNLSNEQNPSTNNSTSQTTTNPNASTADKNLEARQPLQQQTHEGFWGHLNPFARKKYVARQLNPVKDRLNELDELQTKNSNMIKDVDARATEGIRLASVKANEADQHAIDAGNKAQLAQTTATDASTRLTTVQSAVQNIDQFQAASQVEIRFRPGQSVLSHQAKSALDDLADSVKDKKGYIVEVQGFSAGNGSASVENSQRMAQSVVRYLVINHDIPVYRIYTVGMGNAPMTADDGSKKHVRGGRVQVSLLKNAIGDIQVPSNNTNSASSTTNSGGVTGNTATPAQSNPPSSNSVQPSKNLSTPNTPASQPPSSTTEQPQPPKF